MANRNYASSRVFGMHMMPIALDMSVSIGASGAPTIETGSGYGIASITRMAAGQYRIRLQDNYMKLLMLNARMQSPVSGSAIPAGSLSPGTVYQITSMGTTTQAQWVTAGVPVGITAAVGVTFKCAATSAGTGEAKVLGSSGISNVELMGNNVNMLNYQPFNPNLGGYIDIQCMSPSAAAPTFTGSALGTHTHTIPVTAGTAGDAVTNNAGVLESTGGQDLTTNATSAGTPAGSISAPAVSLAAADPANGSKMFIQLLLSNSSVQ